MMTRHMHRAAATVCAVALALQALSAAVPARADDAGATLSYAALVASAQSSASADEPVAALDYYRRALHAAAGDGARERVALFGMARMFVWLGRYPDAEATYRRLMRTDLTPDDRDVALAGLVETLTDEGRPLAAYAAGDAALDLHHPALVVHVARAAEAAGRPDEARRILADGSPALSAVVPNSNLGAMLTDLRRDVRDDLRPYAAASFDGSSDSDGLSIRTSVLAAGARLGATTSVRAALGSATLTHSSWQATGALASVGADATLGLGIALSATVGSAAFPQFRTGTFDTDLGVRPDDRHGFHVFASRDVVRSQLALQQHLAATIAGISADGALGPRATLAASLSRQRFDDGDVRPSATATLGMTISDAAGLSARLRWRGFTDTMPGAAAYFDPQRYAETALLVTEARKLPGTGAWRIRVTGGLGRQNVAPGNTSTTASYELSAGGHIGGCATVDAAFGYANSALAANSGYQRRYAGVSLRCSL